MIWWQISQYNTVKDNDQVIDGRKGRTQFVVVLRAGFETRRTCNIARVLWVQRPSCKVN